MAKGKSVNPADAYRKAQRKKEIKKNKAERTKARNFALVKKDTGDLEEDIEKLEAASELSASDKARLTELKSELERINKKKEEYVVEHPEQRKLVYRSRKQHDDKEEKAEEATAPKKRNMFNKHGLPRHPERSIYYDPVMNPYGVAPPGMPYIERPLRPDEVASDEDHSGEDDDIMMPEGPPPGPENEEVVDSDDDIPMPEGPPPPKDGEPPLSPLSSPPSHPPFVPPAPQLPPPVAVFVPPPPPGLPPMPAAGGFPPGALPPPPPPPGFPGVQLPPPGFLSHNIPITPPGFPPFTPPPPGFFQPQFPPPPPGFFPRRNQSTSSMQDPLSSIPHQTYQAHRTAKMAAPAHPSLPQNPSLPPRPASGSISAATVSAAPELRDFKKESIAFVPSTLKRKRPGAVAGSTSKVNAAPSLGSPSGTEEPEAVPAARPDLLSALRDQFGPAPVREAKTEGAKSKSDYEKFVEEMDDILGPQSRS